MNFRIVSRIGEDGKTWYAVQLGSKFLFWNFWSMLELDYTPEYLKRWKEVPLGGMHNACRYQPRFTSKEEAQDFIRIYERTLEWREA